MKILILILYGIFTYYTSVFSYPVSEAVLWGHKTIALFDFWTLQHIATGIILTYVLTRVSYFKLKPLWVLLLLSLFWESLELILELGHLQGIAWLWNSGVEFWINRSFTDPLAVLFGGYLFRENKKILPYAIMFTVIWLLNILYGKLFGIL